MKPLRARRELLSAPTKRRILCDRCDVTKFSNILRGSVVVVVALALAVLFYQFAHDVGMSIFIFLLAAFAGSLFVTISVVTREN